MSFAPPRERFLAARSAEDIRALLYRIVREHLFEHLRCERHEWNHMHCGRLSSIPVTGLSTRLSNFSRMPQLIIFRSTANTVLAASFPPRGRSRGPCPLGTGFSTFFMRPRTWSRVSTIGDDTPYSIHDVHANRHFIFARRAQLFEMYVIGKKLFCQRLHGHAASGRNFLKLVDRTLAAFCLRKSLVSFCSRRFQGNLWVGS